MFLKLRRRPLENIFAGTVIAARCAVTIAAMFVAGTMGMPVSIRQVLTKRNKEYIKQNYG